MSGHKKLESLNNYNVASNNQQRRMSNVLSCDNSIGKSVPATVLDVPKINNTSISVVSHPSSENHYNNLVPQEFQQKMMETWNPVLPPTFQGANISNCTFNINITYQNPKQQQSPAPKRRRVIFEEDSQ